MIGGVGRLQSALQKLESAVLVKPENSHTLDLGGLHRSIDESKIVPMWGGCIIMNFYK